MKIHSKFQDYYDSALGSFMESDVSVIRKNSIETINLQDIPDLGEFDGKWDTVTQGRYGTTYGYKQIFLLGFCGTWYYFITNWATHKTIMDLDDLEFNKEANIEYKTFDEIVENNKIQSLFKWKQGREFKDPNNDPFMKELFEKFGPVLLIRNFRTLPKYAAPNSINKKLKIEVWPELKAVSFYKVKDAYTTLWEIEHWYDSHARPDEAIVPVGDDLTRLQAYGFDKKTSFRKAKERK